MGADKGYDSKDFVRMARELNVIPHVARNDKTRSSNLARRTTRQLGYAVCLGRRWLKQTGPLRQVKLRGLEKVELRRT